MPRTALALLCLAACFTDKGVDKTDTTADATATTWATTADTTSDLVTTSADPTPASTTSSDSTCGDGQLDADELCDDGNLANNDGCDDACEPEFLRVFVSVGTFSGDLTGEDPRELCQEEADSNDLPGKYRAWIADASEDSPLEEFETANIPYRLVDDTVVANSFDAFLLGTLLAPISLTAGGETPPPGEVKCSGTLAWTGTNADGSLAAEHCKGFTTDSIAQRGAAGDFTTVDQTWSNACEVYCDKQLRLYCFQQPD